MRSIISGMYSAGLHPRSGGMATCLVVSSFGRNQNIVNSGPLYYLICGASHYWSPLGCVGSRGFQRYLSLTPELARNGRRESPSVPTSRRRGPLRSPEEDGANVATGHSTCLPPSEFLPSRPFLPLSKSSVIVSVCSAIVTARCMSSNVPSTYIHFPTSFRCIPPSTRA